MIINWLIKVTNLSLCLLTPFILLLTSCKQETPFKPTWQTINGRDDGIHLKRLPLYRARVPMNWTRKDPADQESIVDTKLPLCEFWIGEGTEHIHLTVHHFPVVSHTSKIPPMAQIQRWKGQFDELHPMDVSTTFCGHGGFTGLCLEAKGIMNYQLTSLLGWSMQLAPEHDQQLDIEHTQTRADYTIKAVGPTHLIAKYRQEIIAFANSFELIKELPSRL
jgi:hypothetical protein